MKQFKLGFKIRAIGFVSIMGMVLMGGLVLVVSLSAKDASTEMNESHLPQLELLSDLDRQVQSASAAISIYVLTGDHLVAQEAESILNTVTHVIETDLIQLNLGDHEARDPMLQTFERVQESFDEIVATTELLTHVRDLMDETGQAWSDALVAYQEHVTARLLGDLYFERRDSLTAAELVAALQAEADALAKEEEAREAEITERAEANRLLMEAGETVVFEIESQETEEMITVVLANVDDLTVLTMINRVLTDMNQLQIANLSGQLIRDSSVVEAHMNSFGNMAQFVTQMNQMETESWERQVLREMTTHTNVYRRELERLVVIGSNLSDLDSQLQEQLTLLLHYTGRLSNEASVSAGRGAEYVEQGLQRLLLGVLLILFVVVILVILASHYMVMSLTRPVKRLVTMANQLAEGQLDLQPLQVKGQDEIGVLTTAFNTMYHQIKEVIEKIADATSQVSDMSSSLDGDASQALTLTLDVDEAIQEIAEGANRQAEETQDALKHMDVFGQKVKYNQSSAGELEYQSNAIVNLTKEGLYVVARLNESAEDSKEAVSSILNVMGLTHASAQKISTASRVISGIAEQTNLLALNAAIEAARAGESGKGFAVVAEEIRKLSNASSIATVEIDQLLKNLLEHSGHAIETGDQVKNIFDNQVSYVTDTKTRYDQIQQALEAMANIIDAMVQTGDVMANQQTQVSEIMMSLAAIAEENAASAEQSADHSSELKTSIAHVRKSGENLRQLALKLDELLLGFVLEGENSHEM